MVSAPDELELPPPAAMAPADVPGAGETPDEELAAAASQGATRRAEAAFGELFRRYRERVHRFVRWRMEAASLRPDDVEEITQEVFFQLYRSLAAYRGRSSFRTWLYGLAHNVCRHQRRRRSSRRRFERPQDALGPDAWTEVPDLAPGALDRMESGELRRRVHRRVSELAPIYREVLVLRDWEDLSYAEIAEVLAIPVGTVRSRLFQARARLAAALVDDGAEECREEETDGV
jgi:RNA polymerase sigma-70 factor, ECF subfamily